jgi:hypothetical protein
MISKPAGLVLGHEADPVWRSCAVQLDINRPDANGTLVTKLTKEISLADLIYFSFVNFFTTGFGDLRPVGGRARLLATFEHFLELIFNSLFIVSAFNFGKQE